MGAQGVLSWCRNWRWEVMGGNETAGGVGSVEMGHVAGIWRRWRPTEVSQVPRPSFAGGHGSDFQGGIGVELYQRVPPPGD